MSMIYNLVKCYDLLYEALDKQMTEKYFISSTQIFTFTSSTQICNVLINEDIEIKTVCKLWFKHLLE